MSAEVDLNLIALVLNNVLIYICVSFFRFSTWAASKFHFHVELKYVTRHSSFSK